jgi:hypothetical protein
VAAAWSELDWLLLQTARRAIIVESDLLAELLLLAGAASTAGSGRRGTRRAPARAPRMTARARRRPEY